MARHAGAAIGPERRKERMAGALNFSADVEDAEEPVGIVPVLAGGQDASLDRVPPGILHSVGRGGLAEKRGDPKDGGGEEVQRLSHLRSMILQLGQATEP